MNRSHGHCMTMGTASTCLDGRDVGRGPARQRGDPGVDARRQRARAHGGPARVEMAKEGLTLSKILTREAFENAIRVNAAIGGFDQRG